MNATNRWKCRECGHICTADHILYADNPFDSSKVICGCPACYEVESLDKACEVEDCDQLSSSGWPDEKGEYHYTCHRHGEHMRENTAIQPYDFSAFDLAAQVLLQSGNIDCL